MLWHVINTCCTMDNGYMPTELQKYYPCCTMDNGNVKNALNMTFQQTNYGYNWHV